MSHRTTRRSFLSATTGGAVLAGGFEFLSRLPKVSAEDARVVGIGGDAAHVSSLAKLIRDTSREKLLEEVAQRIRKGASYREVLAALFLAAVENVQPKPAVGFKFHAVLVVNSCHLASLSGPDQDRWLPIFWALDHFKSSQADEIGRGGWTMSPVEEGQVPSAEKAREQFVEAMKNWDEEQAALAAVGLARTGGATDVFNLFARFAARDFRAIGHKAIYLANACRTLQVIGWEFSEPVLRSLVAAFMNHGDDPNPAQNDLAPDRPWRENQKLVSRIPETWQGGSVDSAAARDMIDACRTASADNAAEAAVKALEKSIAPQSIWDGIFVGAGELLMQQPGIVALHGLTTANAMHYLSQNVADVSLQKHLLLQACSLNALFRDAAKGRGGLAETTYDAIRPSEGGSQPSLEEIASAISSDRAAAASKVESYLARGGDPEDFVDAARRLVFLKGRDSHDYKFSSAVLEDFGHVSPEWRNKFLALSVFNLKGSGEKDNSVVERTRAALQA